MLSEGRLKQLQSQCGVRTKIPWKAAQYLVVAVLSSLLLYFLCEEDMANPQLPIEKWNKDVDGELNAANMERKLRKQGYNYTQYTFGSGTDFPDHTHNVTKKDAIVTGRFEFGMYGQVVVLEPGDMVEVPKNTVHNARVVGNEDVVFYDSTK